MPRPVPNGELRQFLRIGTRGQSHDVEPFRRPADQIERAFADRPRRPKNRHFTRRHPSSLPWGSRFSAQIKRAAPVASIDSYTRRGREPKGGLTIPMRFTLARDHFIWKRSRSLSICFKIGFSENLALAKGGMVSILSNLAQVKRI
jgi:hypothetical protein